MLFSIFLATVGLTAVWAQSGCSILRISGPTLAHHISGRYQKLPSNKICSGRQAYKQEGGDTYLYYHSDSAGDTWLVSDEFCVEEAFLQVRDTAANPEDITATWDEVRSGNWTPNARITVRCDTGGFQGCNEIRVTNARYNTGVEGRYRVLQQTSLCYGRYTYKHVSGDYYLYSTGYWYIDSVNCDTSLTAEVYAQFKDGAFYPENITASGEEPGTFDWTETGLKVICSGDEAIRGPLGLTLIAAALSLILMLE